MREGGEKEGLYCVVTVGWTTWERPLLLSARAEKYLRTRADKWYRRDIAARHLSLRDRLPELSVYSDPSLDTSASNSHNPSASRQSSRGTPRIKRSRAHRR